MKEISFDVQGSAPEPYQVTFVRRSKTNLSAYCNCPAGENGQYCKHRFAILDGINKNITSGNLGDVKTIQSWLIGTDVEEALFNVRELEETASKIKAELSTSKKILAQVMRN